MDVEQGEFVLLRDGTQVYLRPYRHRDLDAVTDLLNRLSYESRAMRFHASRREISDKDVESATSGHVIVAERNGQLLALASYVRLQSRSQAEMGIAVDDAVQGKGIGTVLFERLARDARADGIQTFLALVLPSNVGMQSMIANLGFKLRRTYDYGAIEYEVQLLPSADYQARLDARHHVAAAASLGAAFRPRNVAVVGASRRRGSIGHELFRNILQGGFAGTVYPVNLKASNVASVRAYARVADIPEPIDLGVIIVPAKHVLTAAQECLDAGARALVVISAGFAEIGPEGRQQQQALLTLCRSRNARLIGPNCLGILVNDETGVLNASFGPVAPPHGSVAVASQSGALGIAILNQARNSGIGISSFVSMGNKADVSSNDLIEWWEDDPTTRVITLYLESFGNPRRFSRISRRVGGRKPIVAVKGGRSEAGRRAAASHTAALASSDVAVDALFRQAGTIRAASLEELFDIVAILANQPLPTGNRVAIVTNAGGLGILCADACDENELTVAPLTEATQAALRQFLPTEAATSNPVDMLAAASADTYERAIRIVLEDPNVDAVIVLYIPPLVTTPGDIGAALEAACRPTPAKPVVASFVGVSAGLRFLQSDSTIPVFAFPESAARALAKVTSYASWLRRPAGEIQPFSGVDRDAARAIIDTALAREERPWLTPEEVTRFLRAYNIPQPEGMLVHSAQEAAEAATTIGKPLAIKVASTKVLHKSDVGGVRLNVEGPEAAAAAYQAIEEAMAAAGHGADLDGVLVQPMLTGGVECLVGVVTDPLFGPLIAFGLGGVTAEILGDIKFRLHPLTNVDADELINQTKAAAMLAGFRGAPPADVPALQELLLRVSQMVEDVPEILELDMNPVIIRPLGDGAYALDARVRVGAVPEVR